MKMYSIDQAFGILRAYKITTSIESVRRWLRNGDIIAAPPRSRKQGWQITQDALDQFIESRMPSFITLNDAIKKDVFITPNNVIKKENTITSNDAIRAEESITSIDVIKKQAKEQAHADVWHELTRKNIWEGYMLIKKSEVKQAAEHHKHSDDFVDIVWDACIKHSRSIGYKQPRVSYLLDAFMFDGKRILFDKKYDSLEEQVIFAIFDYITTKIKRRISDQ